LILVGEVMRPHGLRGDVVVAIHSEAPGRFAPGATLLAGPSPESASEKQITASGPAPGAGRLLVRFEGASGREAAESMRGELLFVDSSRLGPLEPDTFWEHELTGVEVVDGSGRKLGTIARVLSRQEQDLWEVEGEEGSFLMPAAKDLVRSVDLAARRAVVELPPGLAQGEEGGSGGVAAPRAEQPDSPEAAIPPRSE
jgi:16S rRNA processing protein RimM